jgi:hypothetical protein
VGRHEGGGAVGGEEDGGSGRSTYVFRCMGDRGSRRWGVLAWDKGWDFAARALLAWWAGGEGGEEEGQARLELRFIMRGVCQEDCGGCMCCLCQ